MRLPGLGEASGLAPSRRSAGRLWAHNDSSGPVVFALDSNGAVLGQVRLAGAMVEDWEAITVAPCSAGSCLYVGDIGDNAASRRRITVYEVPEPDRAAGTAMVSAAFHFTYPDGAHDAETLFAGPDGRLHIVTKGEDGPIALYRFPAQLQAGGTMRLERVAALPPKDEADVRITDGTLSPDGRWVVLRSASALTVYPAADLLRGEWRIASRIDLTSLKEPQGEGVAMSRDTIFLAGEGGGASGGTFARFPCTMAPLQAR